MTIGDQLKVWRARYGVSQHRLAMQLGVRSSTVSSWELGRCDVGRQQLARIGDALGIPADEIARAAALPSVTVTP